MGYLEDGSLGVDGLKGASSVEISSDNSLVYISGRKENSIAAFLGQELSLPRVLEGGTWHVGRKLAYERSPLGEPPLNINTDGTVF